MSQRSLTTPRLFGLGLLIVLCIAALYSSLAFGSRSISGSELWTTLLSRDPNSAAYNTVWLSRVPRTLIILVAGVALGVSGAVMHAVTRNPLTDPGILGVNSGASFAVVLGIVAFNANAISHYRWFALIGALLTSLVVFIVGSYSPTGGRRDDPVRLTLTGVAFGAVLTGMTTILLLTNSTAYFAMRGWAAGTTAQRPTEAALEVAPLIIMGLLLAALSWRGLDAMALGEPTAIALGFNPGRIRLVALCCIALLAGGATAAAGPIAFVGLLTAHLARALIGPHQGWITAYALVAAPLILAIADVLGRILTEGEIPVGVVTPILGAPLLVFIARRMRVIST